VVKNYLISYWKDKADKFKGLKDTNLHKILEHTVEVEMLQKEVHKLVFPEENTVSCFRLLFQGYVQSLIIMIRQAVRHISGKLELESKASHLPLLLGHPPAQCPGKSEGEKCVQNIKVSLQDPDEVAKIKGQGISYVPEEF
jgi:hypothetical protein